MQGAEYPTKARKIGRWLGVLGPDLRQAAELGPDWRLDYLFSIAGVSWVIHLCVTGLAGFVLISTGLGSWVFWWIGLQAALSLAMIVLAASYRRERRGAPWIHGRVHSFLTSVAGATWGGGAVACAVESSAEMLSFYTLVLGGTALGAVSSQHIFARSCLVSIWTSVPLLSLSWLVHGVSPSTLATAGMMLLFGLMLSAFAIRMNDFVTQNVALSNALRTKNADLERTNEKLADAYGEKSRFLAQASHDLRQPIHAIGLFVEYLGTLRLGREGREVLRNIDLSLESLTRLCRSLLDLAALDVGRVTPHVEPVALNELIGEVVRQAREAGRSQGIEIRMVPTRSWVQSDQALLHTMIQNLVSKAYPFPSGEHDMWCHSHRRTWCGVQL